MLGKAIPTNKQIKNVCKSNPMSKSKVKESKNEKERQQNDETAPFSRRDKMRQQMLHHARHLKYPIRTRANTMKDPLLISSESEETLNVSTLSAQEPSQTSPKKKEHTNRLCKNQSGGKPQICPKFTKSSVKQKAYRAAQLKKEADALKSRDSPSTKRDGKMKSSVPSISPKRVSSTPKTGTPRNKLCSSKFNNLDPTTSPQKCSISSLHDNGLTKKFKTSLSMDTSNTCSKIVTDSIQNVSQALTLEMNEEMETDTNEISAPQVDLGEIEETDSNKKESTFDVTEEGNNCFIIIVDANPYYSRIILIVSKKVSCNYFQTTKKKM
jgi:hypothetical protein